MEQRIQEREDRLRTLFKKEKKLLWEAQRLALFKEPILILLRRSGIAEFYEGIDGSTYEYTHSSGEKRYFILKGGLYTFDYANKGFRAYICHEDHPLPLPEDPILTSEQFAMAIDKAIHDHESYKSKKLSDKGEMWLKILKGVGLVLAIYLGYKFLLAWFVGEPTVVTQVIKDNVTAAVDNLTRTTPFIG